VLLSPVFIVIALVILATSPGPIFFRQARVGYKGKIFHIYKFRTLKPIHNDPDADTDKSNRIVDGTLKKPLADHIYPFGNFLRRTSLDELPQLINVFLGNMAFIGPRPHPVWEIDELYPKWYTRILDRVPPGLTGLNQAKLRHTADPRTESRHDAFWMRNKSKRLSFAIVMLTIAKIFTMSG